MAWLDDIFGRGLPGVARIQRGKGFALGEIVTLPPAEIRRRGEMRRTEGATGVADRLVWLRKNAGDAYEWADIPTLVGAAKGVLPVWNVKDYGAKGDGVTDDQPVIQRVIDACNADGGGIVYLPPGTYMVGDNATIAAVAVYVKARVHLMGAGRNVTTIKLMDSTNCATVAYAFDEDDMACTDLTIDGNRANQTLDVHGLRFQGNARTYSARLLIKECRRYGIGVGYTNTPQYPWRDSIVEDVEIHDIGHDAVGDGFDGKRSERCTVRRLYVHDIVANGIDLRANHSVCSDIYIADVGQVGFSQRCSAYDPPDTGTLLTGTVSTTSGSITVTGTGTAFLTEVRKDDQLRITDTSEKLIVADIASNTSLTVQTASANNEASSTAFNEYIRQSRHHYAQNITVERCGTHGFWMEAVEADDGGGVWFTEEWFGRTFLVNAIARQCGGRGFYIAGGDGRMYSHLTNCLAERCESHGFQLNANDVADVHIKLVNCTARLNGVDGFNILSTNAVGDILLGCEAYGNAEQGFTLGGLRTTLMGFRSESNLGDGVRINGDDCLVSGGSILTDSDIGVRVNAGDRNTVRDCSIATTTGTGINVITGAVDTLLSGNNLSGVGGTKLVNSGTTTRFDNNLGYVSRNAGVTSVADGGTIAHGLAATPTKYGATTTTADEFLAISAVSSTTLTIQLTKHDGTAGTTANVAWWAEI